MAQWLVLQDFKSREFSARSGQILDDKHVPVSRLLSAGLSVIGYSGLFDPAIDAQNSQRRINPLSEGDIGMELMARGLFPGLTGALPAGYTVINTISDFPSPIGNVITLPAGVYWINGAIVMGDTNIVMEKGAQVRGVVGDRDQLVWSAGTGPRITLTGTGGDENYEFRNLGFIDTLGTEDLLGMTGKPFNIIFRYTTMIGRGGTISAANLFVFDSSQLLNAEKGFTFTGVCNFAFFRFSGINGGGTSAGPLIDLGTSVWNRFSFNDVGFLTVAGQTALTGLASNGNLAVSTGRGETILARFEGPGPALAGITVDDLQWLFAGNTFVPNSIVIGNAELLNNTTETVAPNTGPLVTISGTFIESLDRRFVTSAGGVMTYLGLNPRAFQVQVQLLAEMASGGSKDCSFQIFHTPLATGTPVGLGTPFGINVSNQASPVGLLSGVELLTGDTLDIRVRNEDDTVNILVTDLEALVTAIASGV